MAVWVKEIIGYGEDGPAVGAKCPFCGKYWALCRRYGGRWHADRYMMMLHGARCAERPLPERKREWRPGRRRGPDAYTTLTMVYDEVSPNVPRSELPDELGTTLAAGLAKVDRRWIRHLCAAGAIKARKGEVYDKAQGWLIDTDDLLRWMRDTGRRRPDA